MRTFRLTLVTSLLAVSACGSAGRSSAPGGLPPTAVVSTSTATAAVAPPAASSPGAPTATSALSALPTALPDALVRAGDAVFAVSPASGTVRASWPDAVVSADGASAYRIESGVGGADVVRIATRTGGETGRWPVAQPGAWRVAVVSADGRRVVATDGVVDRAHRSDRTRLLVIDPLSPGHVARLLDEPGTIEPEAIATDGTVVYVLDHRATYYRVRSLNVADDVLYDTISRDKAAPPEDMHGDAVRAVPSPDGTLLSTLYRLPSPTAGATPFVHVLDLAHGWSYCADLPPGEYDRIATSDDGRTLVVAATDGTWIAVDLTEMGMLSDVPLPLAVHRDGTPPVTLATGGSLIAGAITVTVDAGTVVWHLAGSPPTTVASVAWPADRPGPQLVALVTR